MIMKDCLMANQSESFKQPKLFREKIKKESKEVSLTKASQKEIERKMHNWQIRNRIAYVITLAKAELGLLHQAMQGVDFSGPHRNILLREIAEVVAKSGDKERFKLLLLPCAFCLSTAYRVCELLTQLYPYQQHTIEKIIGDNLQSRD
jgi:hypothetical protein